MINNADWIPALLLGQGCGAQVAGMTNKEESLFSVIPVQTGIQSSRLERSESSSCLCHPGLDPGSRWGFIICHCERLAKQSPFL